MFTSVDEHIKKLLQFIRESKRGVLLSSTSKEFRKLGIIGENEDISDELLDYFRNLIELNKPFLSSFSKTKKSDENNSEDSEEN